MVSLIVELRALSESSVFKRLFRCLRIANCPLERIPVMFVNKRSQRGSENSCILRD
jgi:hypothetical protein